MPKLPGINHLNAVKAFEKAGFRIIRQGEHIVMSDGIRFLTIPRHNPVNAFTMAGLIRDAGLTMMDSKSDSKIQRFRRGLTGSALPGVLRA